MLKNIATIPDSLPQKCSSFQNSYCKALDNEDEHVLKIDEFSDTYAVFKSSRSLPYLFCTFRASLAVLLIMTSKHALGGWEAPVVIPSQFVHAQCTYLMPLSHALPHYRYQGEGVHLDDSDRKASSKKSQIAVVSRILFPLFFQSQE